MLMIDHPARYDLRTFELGYMLIISQESLKHVWLSGENATDHNLLPEIKAYMAKARLRRGIEIIKLANRIEALRMQEDEEDGEAEQADVPENAKAAAGEALSGADAGHAAGSSAASTPAPSGAPKKTLSSIAKGAIFREVVLAKVREMKAAEDAAQVELEAQEKANTGSGGSNASTIKPNKKSG